MVYHGYTLVKTDKQAWDWRTTTNGHARWGTLVELQHDIDNALQGDMPKRERGYA